MKANTALLGSVPPPTNGKAGPKLQVFYQNLAQILFTQVEPLFFEFLEDLRYLEGDEEAKDIIRDLAWKIQFGR